MSYDGLVSIDTPGSFIKDELEARKWSQRDLAFILGKAEQELNVILTGKRAISADMARLLSAAFVDIPAEFFLNLQARYDLQKARLPDPGVRGRALLQRDYPVRDMIRRGWMQDGEMSLLKLQVDRFFEVANDDNSSCAFAAKRTHYDETSPQQLAWIFRVRQLARTQNVHKYSEKYLRNALEKLKALIVDPEAVSFVPKILAECGVRFVVVEVLPGAKIDGVCTWLDDDSPVIGMSTLYDRIDNFWFVLAHEIEHVLCGHGKTTFGKIDYFNDQKKDNDLDSEEIVANTAAAEFCLSQKKLKSFYIRKKPYFSEKDVVGFSAVLEVHPGIVVGQMQRLLGRYNFLRKYQVPVRKYLLETAMVDGWGSVVDMAL